MGLRPYLLFAAALFPFLASAREPQVPPPDLGPHTIPRLTSEITVDGVLDEPAWEGAWSMELAFEVSPGENIPPPVRTVILAAHDDDALYFAFRAFDPEPEAIRAHLSDRDNVGADDWVLVLLDTFNDERRSFDFMVNPLGIQSDFIEASNGGGGSWDTIWDSAGQITDWGYVVELRVPFSSIRFQRTVGPQVWGIDAVRSYPRGQDHRLTLFPRDRNNNCYLCQAVKIEGFEGVTPGRNIEVVPTVTGIRSDERDELPDGDLTAGDVDLEAGITASWGFTPNLTAAGTINPDFSQVEADARQLEVNERFALFYDEKRPFFMEGADFFTTRLQTLYTRTMHDPVWGLKLTGKEGDHTIGAYVVEDEVTNLIFPSSEGSDQTSLEQSNLSSVLRYRRDFGNRITIGGMATARSGDDYSNQVVGVDGAFRFTDTDRIQVELFSSSTRYPDQVVEDFEQPDGRFRDWATDILWVHDARNLNFWALYQRIGEDYRSDLGFNPQVGHTAYLVGSEYDWVPDGDGWYSFLEIGTEYIYMEDADGTLLSRENSLYGVYQGPLQSHATLHLYRRSESFAGELFDKNEIAAHLCLKPSGDSHLYVDVKWGDQIDYANTRLGERVRVNPGGFLNLGRHFKLELDYLYELMEVAGEELYTAAIAQGTFTYQMTARTFVRAIVQYVDNEFNLALYDDPSDMEAEEKLLFGQLLFSYKLDPRTVLFLGYTEGQLGTRDYPLTTSNRTLFAKIGYSWRL